MQDLWVSGHLKDVNDVVGDKARNYAFFVPNPLPEALELDSTTVRKLEEASLRLGELNGLARLVGNIHLFISIYKRKEALFSTRIEGTRISFNEVLENESMGSEKKFSQDMYEVRNYINTLNYALDNIKGARIDKVLLNSMHMVLLMGVRGQDRHLGKYRTVQNYIGSVSDIELASFVPPHPEQVEQLMQDFFRFMDSETKLPHLVKVALMHYYFETIHPYEDGNGRLGRTLIVAYLKQLGILEQPLLYLSEYFKRNQVRYFDALMKARKESDLTTWINFFLDGVVETANATSLKVKAWLGLERTYRKKLNATGKSKISLELLEQFFQNPYQRASELQKRLGKDYSLVRRGIDDLIKIGLVRQLNEDRERNRVYFADEIFALISDE